MGVAFGLRCKRLYESVTCVCSLSRPPPLACFTHFVEHATNQLAYTYARGHTIILAATLRDSTTVLQSLQKR